MSRFIVAALLALGGISEARAWGQEGHSIVAELAERQLTAKARAAVASILGGPNSLASTSNWADDVRPTRPKSYNWHFVDIPLASESYEAARDCEDNDRGDCVINSIDRTKATLRDAGAPLIERRDALRFLVHFMGDLHQPLHSVKEYRGGNDLHVTFFTDPLKTRRDKTNLHAVWDSGLIKASFWNWGAYADFLTDTWLPSADIQKLLAGNTIDWALEAHRAAREIAFTAKENDDLGEDYLSKTRPTVDRQLAAGGVRLGAMLNELLGQ